MSTSAELCRPGQELLEAMLTFDPSRRISASEALRHPYFRDDGYVPLLFSPSDTSGINSSSPRSTGSSSGSSRNEAGTPIPMSCSSNDDSGHSSGDGQLPDH